MGEAVCEAFGHGKWREHALGCQRQERGAEERPHSMADQVANDRDRRKREQWHIGARCRPDNKTRPLTASGWSSGSAKADERA